MDLFEAIAKRLSYRGAYSDEAVSQDNLKRVVHAGLQAPSGRNAQTTEFIIIDKPELVAEIQKLHPNNKAMQTAPAYIACCVNTDPDLVYEGFSFEIEDCAAAVENMLLSITAMGYASVWIDGWLRLEGRAETIGKLVKLPQGKIIRIILPIGVPVDEYRQPPKKPFEERAWFNSYKNQSGA